MRVQVDAFYTQKAGNAPDEYEDAFWPRRATKRDAPAFRCAVADGATETSFAAIWAKILVRSYCRGELSPRRIPATLTRIAAGWRRDVGTRPLPWYAEEKLRDGAFSSLAGVTLRAGDAEMVTWEATSIGDSCLFQIHRDALVAACPLCQSSSFNSRPQLVSTNPSRNGDLKELVLHECGVAQQGDVFFLMTDALAVWFLTEFEQGKRPWHRLLCKDEAFDDASFPDWVGSLRADRSIRNDDVTLMIVRLL